MNAAGQGGLLTAGRLAYLHAPDEGDGEEEDDDEEGEEGEDVEAAPQVCCIVVSYVAPAGRRPCRGTVHMIPPHHVQLHTSAQRHKKNTSYTIRVGIKRSSESDRL